MKSVVLALSAASSVAAQLAITIPAEFNAVNAINPKDPEYTACSAGEIVVDACVSAVGGTDAVLTADPTKLLNCLCCDGATGISPIYSVCSTYIMNEAPEYRSQASAFGDFYSLCGLGAACTGGGAQASTPRTTPSARATPTAATTPTGSSRRATTTATEVDPNQTYPAVCEDMIAIFTSCSAKIDDFVQLPYREQAQCYCCRTGRGGTLSYTTELDSLGKSCASWAITGETINAYPVAKTFASFCQNFPDACKAAATATTGSGNAQTTGGSVTQNGGSEDVTVTVTPTPTNAANGLRAGCGAAVAAGAAFALAL